MCEGSVYVKHRASTNKEELVLRRIPDHSMKGLYAPRGSLLVCTLPGTKAVIDEVKLISGVFDLRGTRSVFTSDKFARAREWEGKTNVEVTFISHNMSTGDSMKMPDGVVIHLSHFQDGVRVGIGREVKPPRDLEKDLGMDQIRADVPHDTAAEKRAELDDLARDYARDAAAEKA